MNLSQILPCKFSSNIYSHREMLSEWLTNFVAVRSQIGTLIYNEVELALLDEYLIKAHYKFEQLIKQIDLMENDLF